MYEQLNKQIDKWKTMQGAKDTELIEAIHSCTEPIVDYKERVEEMFESQVNEVSKLDIDNFTIKQALKCLTYIIRKDYWLAWPGGDVIARYGKEGTISRLLERIKELDN